MWRWYSWHEVLPVCILCTRSVMQMAAAAAALLSVHGCRRRVEAHAVIGTLFQQRPCSSGGHQPLSRHWRARTVAVWRCREGRTWRVDGSERVLRAAHHWVA
eukprot:GHVS01046432.1.p2 GENE.GHVS01046432.1~~GHVS01046432.1.p2  ORF type:complete len:102 (+),score=8.15 GHVS01046432.1:333-638(+)